MKQRIVDTEHIETTLCNLISFQLISLWNKLFKGELQSSSLIEYSEIDRQSDRQPDRQTERKIERDSERKREIKREKYGEKES